MTLTAVARRSPLVPLALGGLMAFGQEPYGAPILMMLALVAVVWLFPDRSNPRAAFMFGWLVSLGYFLHSLQWIVSPFMVDVSRHGWMAPFALLFLAAGIALFWGLAFACAMPAARKSSAKGAIQP